MKRLLTLLALACAAASSFAATLNPVQLLNPAGSTAGQVPISNGPSSAPSWGSTLSATSFTGTVTNNTAGTAVSIGGSTPVAGNPSKFYYPTYFGNAGTGVTGKFNRLQVGLEALSSLDVITGNVQTTQSWVHTYLPAAMSAAALAVTSTLGSEGIAAAARTSDFRTAFGGASGGAAGIYALGLGDDTGPGNPIACGVCGVVAQLSGVTGISLNQMDVSNYGAVVDVTPNSGVVGGTTFAMGLTAGAYNNTLNNPTAAMYIGNGLNAKFRKGIIFFSGTNGGLDTSVGAGGSGVALEMGTGQSFRWLDNTNATKAEMWGSSSGLNISPGIVGVTDGSVGASGIVGQYVNHSTSNTSMTTGTGANCDSISLTAGEYDVTGVIQFNPAGSTTVSGINAGISLSSAVLPGYPLQTTLSATLTTGGVQSINTPVVRISPTSTTTLYLVGQAGFGTSTMTCNGAIRARRVR